jgi:putative ABC transport system permease protein
MAFLHSGADVKPQSVSFSWLLTMAWRDSRQSRSRLALFAASIVLGTAALVAINSFRANLRTDIASEAKELLGADLEVERFQPFSERQKALFDSLGGEQARQASFASMVGFSGREGRRLSNVRALRGPYPFYGKIETDPPKAVQSFRKGRRALVDRTLMLQFDAEVGDSIEIGKLRFKIVGTLLKIPGQNSIASQVAPAVYIPYRFLQETGLVQKGSRIQYSRFFKLPSNVESSKLMERLGPRLSNMGIDYETVDSRKRAVGRAFENLTNFLNLVGFIALLLGCVGVASAVHLYVKEKIPTVGVMRCLGVKGSDAFGIYLVQIVGMGLIGSFAGAALGSFLQVALPQVLADFLPVDVSASVRLPAILQGIGVGVGIALLFALGPLLRIRRTSPLVTLKGSEEEARPVWRDQAQLAVGAGILLFVLGFARMQLDGWKEAFFFTVFVGVSAGLLAGVARGLMGLARRYFPQGWSYLWRQALANLFRPNNQTLILTLGIGFGTALVATLSFVQTMLLEQISFQRGGDQPNLLLFDIQPKELDKVTDFVQEQDLPVMQKVPVVAMQAMEIRGIKPAVWKSDSADLPDHVVDREYRVTYRDSLKDNEEIVAGEWVPRVTPGRQVIPVSVSTFLAEDAGLEVGDRMRFNVQGAPLEVEVASIRKVEFNRIQTNFSVVFPEGALNRAPKTYVLISRAADKQTSARFQQALFERFPTISVVDLELIIDTVGDVVDKIAFVIRFMALFSILTGLLVLVGSVAVSKYQRLRESVLLRTLGASRRQILSINALEYVFLGLVAALSGILLALAATYVLSLYSFSAAFVPDIGPVLGLAALIAGLTVGIGMLNTRGLLNQPPLEVLRKEVA